MNLGCIVGLKEWIVPQDKAFFDLFEQMADTVNEGAVFLNVIINNYVDVQNQCHKMKQIEHQGDLIAHQVYEQLNRTFITPLEPEEISRLATALDDILDYSRGHDPADVRFGPNRSRRFHEIANS